MFDGLNVQFFFFLLLTKNNSKNQRKTLRTKRKIGPPKRYCKRCRHLSGKIIVLLNNIGADRVLFDGRIIRVRQTIHRDGIAL